MSVAVLVGYVSYETAVAGVAWWHASSIKTKLLGLEGGYSQSSPRSLQRLHDGACLPHFLLARAQVLQADRVSIRGVEIEAVFGIWFRLGPAEQSANVPPRGPSSTGWSTVTGSRLVCGSTSLQIILRRATDKISRAVLGGTSRSSLMGQMDGTNLSIRPLVGSGAACSS